jgi:PhnB protein
MDEFRNAITPVLTVRRAAEAVVFYEAAFGAREIVRDTQPDGKVVAEMAVGDAHFRIADESPEWNNLSPQSLNGTSVRINLFVQDPDGVARRAIANGASEVSPVADQSIGLR